MFWEVDKLVATVETALTFEHVSYILKKSFKPKQLFICLSCYPYFIKVVYQHPPSPSVLVYQCIYFSFHGCNLPQLQDDNRSVSGEVNVNFQITKDTGETTLKSMYYIRDQLSNVVPHWIA